MRFLSILSAVCLICTSAFGAAIGATSITLNPSTPAPNEPLTITVRGVWSDGCVPQFQSVTGSGSTIEVNALSNPGCGACTLVNTPYAFTSDQGRITAAGLYTVNFYVTECNKPRALIASQQFAISASCQFDRALKASAPAVRLGDTLVLTWCDPSVVPGADIGYSVSFYRILLSHSLNGPFLSVGDVAGQTGARINFDSTDLGPNYFYIEAHGCNVTIAGCTGDIVLRSNIVRVDVVTATACLPDATTLCLNNGRFKVTAQWQTADGKSGAADAVMLADDSGYFWFFSPDVVELVVKALNGCSQPVPRYWFFASGLTNVGVDIIVTDTKAGTTKTYHNPIGTAFPPIQDTGAFATCP